MNSVERRNTQSSTKVERPDSEKVEARVPRNLDWQEDFEAGIEGGGASQAEVAEAKNTEAFVARPLLPLGIRERESGALCSDHVWRCALWKDGNVRSKLAKKHGFLVDGHVDVPDQNSHP
jgi:hypothetical protein